MEPPKDPQLLAAWVQLAPPSMVADWISTLKLNRWSGDYGLKVAKARNDPFIDFVLALYANDNEILSQLWNTGDAAIRRAILSNVNKDEFHYLNPYFLSEEESKSFYERGDLNDINLLVTNPTFGNTALSYLFERKEAFADLTDERFHAIAVNALMNPNLHKEYIDKKYNTDGHEWYIDNRAKSQALKLLFDVPAEDRYAYALSEAFDLFPYIDPPDNLFSDLKAPIWKREFTDKEREEWRISKRFYNQEFLKRAFARWTFREEEDKTAFHPSVYLRMAIASKVPTSEKEIRSWLETHADPWIRLGVAKTKHFSRPEEVEKWYARDGWAFLDAVYSNPCFHLRSNREVAECIRGLLRQRDDAEKQGYHFDDSDLICHRWFQEAEHLHNESPLDYYSGDEYPNNLDDIAVAAQQDEPVKELLEKLEQELIEISRSREHNHKQFLYSFRILSKIISALNIESSKRVEAMSESILSNIRSQAMELIRLNGRSKFLAFLIISLAVFIYLR